MPYEPWGAGWSHFQFTNHLLAMAIYIYQNCDHPLDLRHIPGAQQDPSSAGKLVIRFHIEFPQSIPPSAGDDLEVGGMWHGYRAD